MPVIVEKGKQVNSRYGHYPHDSMIDVPFGSKVRSEAHRRSPRESGLNIHVPLCLGRFQDWQRFCIPSQADP